MSFYNENNANFMIVGVSGGFSENIGLLLSGKLLTEWVKAFDDDDHLVVQFSDEPNLSWETQ